MNWPSGLSLFPAHRGWRAIAWPFQDVLSPTSSLSTPQPLQNEVVSQFFNHSVEFRNLIKDVLIWSFFGKLMSCSSGGTPEVVFFYP